MNTFIFHNDYNKKKQDKIKQADESHGNPTLLSVGFYKYLSMRSILTSIYAQFQRDLCYLFIC